MEGSSVLPVLVMGGIVVFLIVRYFVLKNKRGNDTVGGGGTSHVGDYDPDDQEQDHHDLEP